MALVPYTHGVVILEIADHWSTTLKNHLSFSLFGLLIWHILMAAGYWLYFYSLAHVFTLSFSISTALITMFNGRMRQNCAILAQLNRKRSTRYRFSASTYYDFRRKLIETIGFFFAANRMHGKLFFAALVVFCPAQCLLTMWLLLGKVPKKQVPAIHFFNLYEFNFIFIIHLLLALVSRNFHRPGRELLSLMAGSTTRMGNLRARLRLRLDIDWMVTHRKYGFNYGSFGLISLNAFSKYVLPYGKVMMITFKLVRENY